MRHRLSEATQRCGHLVFFSLIEIQLIHSDALVSGIQQRDSIIHTCVSVLLQILFHDGLLQDTEYGSLCYTVDLCCLPLLYSALCIY